MEEILRDSEKEQYVPALPEGSSDASGQTAADGSAGQTAQPPLQLVLDPSTTGIASVLSPSSHMAGFFLYAVSS